MAWNPTRKGKWSRCFIESDGTYTKITSVDSALGNITINENDIVLGDDFVVLDYIADYH